MTSEQERSTSETDFFTELFPIHFLFKWFGCGFVITKGPPGNREFVPITNKLYRAIPYVHVVVICAIFIYLTGSMGFLKKNFLGMWFLNIFRFYAAIGFMLSLVVIRGYSRLNLVEIYKKFIAFDNKGQLKLNMCVDHRLVQRKAAVGLATQAAILLLFMISSSNMEFELKMVAHFFMYVCRFLVGSSARLLTYYILARFRLINTYLGGDRRVDSMPLRDIADLYSVLQEMTKTISQYYSLIFLLELSLDFSSLVAVCYEWWRKGWMERSFELGAMIFNGLWSVYTLMGIMSLVWICDKIPRSIRQTKRQLLHIALKDKYFSKTEEILAFSHQFFYSDSHITAGGFFAIDFSLIFSMTAALNTYLVILVQFDLTNSKNV